MKNTKHTEMNDSSIEQDNQENLSQSKRKILTSIGVTSGVVGASALVPSTWVKPAVNSVILPAHAQSTPAMMTTAAPAMTTAAPAMTTEAPDMTTEAPAMTTEAPPAPAMTTEAPPAPATAAIVLSPASGGVVDASGTDGVVVSVKVRLAKEPSAPVTVTPTGTNVTSLPTTLPFTVLNWDEYQVVNLTIANAAHPDSEDDEEEAMVTFAAGDGGGYDDVEAEWTYTAGYYGQIHATMVDAKAGSTGSRSATITWKASETRATVTGYRVSSGVTGVTSQTVTGTSVTFTGLPVGAHTFTVTAVYGTTDATAGTAPTDEVTII